MKFKEGPKTETVDVAELVWRDKVVLVGREFTVDEIDRSIDFTLRLNEVGGANYIELYDIEPGTTFSKVVDDPEDFRVRSAIEPVGFWFDFENDSGNPGLVAVSTFTWSNRVATMSVDKADLKAVVEKL